jgi:hypothetical protein
MFNSISIATPNSTVTSSFVADETCVIDVASSFPVRVNGTATSARPINLVSGDTIQIDVVAPAAKSHRFIDYTYNDSPSCFAVVANSGDTRLSLKSRFINFLPTDLPRTNNSGYHQMVSPNGTETPINSSSWGSTQINQDLVVFFEGPFYNGTKKVNYYALNGNQISEGSEPNGALDGTIVWNNGSQNWEQFWLMENGVICRIDKSYGKTNGTAVMTNAKCIFSDTVTLFVGGVNFLNIMSDINAIGRTIALVDETVYGGEAIGNGFILTTNKGNVYKSTPTGIEVLYHAQMVGRPTKFKNQYIVPVPTEWAIRVYDANFDLVKTIDTGDRIPMYARAGRNSFSVSFASSHDAAIFTSVDEDPAYRTFSRDSTFSVPGGDNLFSSTRFDDYEMVIPANPPVYNVNPTPKNTPTEVDVGSGEFTVSTLGENLPVYVSPNAQLLLNGLKVTDGIVNAGSKIAMYGRSTEGRTNLVMIVGYFAYDMKVNAIPGEFVSRYVDIPNIFMTAQAVFNVVVPEEVDNAPIAISHGSMTVNGVTHDGLTRVNAGDVLAITIDVPTGLNSYYGMLSFADAQYALVVNTAAETIKDTQRYRDFGDLETYSTITVDSTDTFDLPNYTNVKVTRNDEELSFPVELTEGDEITIRHVRASGVWYDRRDTVLIGIGTNYIVRSFSYVDDVPDEMDFGIVHNGIPDFEYDGDLFPEVLGLTEGYSIEIFHPRMTFSVNGGPFEVRPTVKNGDTVQARYNVKNFFETQWAKTLLSDGETEYEFGFLNIDPTLGQFMPPLSDVHPVDTDWLQVWEHPSESAERNIIPLVTTQKETNSSGGYFSRHQTGFGPVKNPLLMIGTRAEADASKGAYNTASVPIAKVDRTIIYANIRSAISTLAFGATSATDGRIIATEKMRPSRSIDTQTKRTARLSTFRSIETQTKSPKHLFENQKLIASEDEKDPVYGFQNFENTDIEVIPVYSHEMSFGKAASYQIFIPVFDFEASVLPTRVTPFYAYLNDPSDRIYEPEWLYVNEENPYWTADSIWFKPLAAQHLGYNAGWVRSYKHLEYQDIFGTADTVDNEIEVIIESKPVPTASVAAVYSPSVMYAGVSVASKEVKAKATPELYSASSNVSTAGGFETEDAAEEAAILYSQDKPYEVYQQPEGSFSFIVKRDTGLVCEVKNAGFTVVAWLIGGG